MNIFRALTRRSFLHGFPHRQIGSRWVQRIWGPNNGSSASKWLGDTFLAAVHIVRLQISQAYAHKHSPAFYEHATRAVNLYLYLRCFIAFHVQPYRKGSSCTISLYINDANSRSAKLGGGSKTWEVRRGGTKPCLPTCNINKTVERRRDTRADGLKQLAYIGGPWWHALSRALPRRISVSQCKLDGQAGCRNSWCAHEVARYRSAVVRLVDACVRVLFYAENYGVNEQWVVKY
jgi:hypothetical protein